MFTIGSMTHNVEEIMKREKIYAGEIKDMLLWIKTDESTLRVQEEKTCLLRCAANSWVPGVVASALFRARQLYFKTGAFSKLALHR